MKRQHLTTLQRDLDNTARHLRIRASIVTTPWILKLTLVLGFRLDHCDDLGTGFHHFGLGQKTYTTRKVLKARTDQHQVIAGSGAAPYLAEASTLTATEGVSLPATLTMERGSHTRIRVFLVTLFGPDHPKALAMRDVNTDIMERET